MKTLDDAAVFMSGGTPKTSKPEYWRGDITWYSASNMDQKFLSDREPKITKAGLEAGSKLAPKGATLLLVRGSGLFKYIPICYADTDVAFNQDVKAICAKENEDPLFIHYWLESMRIILNNNIEFTGIGAGKLDTDFLKDLPFPNLDKEDQKRIGILAASFDRKIENNSRTNETLEEMARTIFKSWFVDFDPVRAKAEGSQPAHMDTETAALFPSSFGDDGLPVGWAWHKMGDCVSLTKGRSYKSVELQESDTALVTLKSFLRGGGYRVDGLKAYTGKYKDEQTLVSGDLVVALTDVTQEADVIGKPAIVRSDGTFQTLVASLDVGVLRPIVPSISIPFLYCMMMTNDFQAHIYGHTSGTTVLHLGKEGVPKYKFPMPSNEVIARFTVIAESIFSKIELNKNNSNTLAETRDTLLPKLMSGKIRVKDAEKEVEAFA